LLEKSFKKKRYKNMIGMAEKIVEKRKTLQFVKHCVVSTNRRSFFLVVKTKIK
jgi:hypothetical protein